MEEFLRGLQQSDPPEFNRLMAFLDEISLYAFDRLGMPRLRRIREGLVELRTSGGTRLVSFRLGNVIVIHGGFRKNTAAGKAQTEFINRAVAFKQSLSAGKFRICDAQITKED